MSKLSSSIARFPVVVGWPGGLGIALLAATLIMVVTLWLPTRRENTLLQQDLQRMEQKVSASVNHVSSSQLGSQLARFSATLPSEHEIDQALDRLHRIADRHHLTLNHSDYRAVPPTSGMIGQLKITAKAYGTYPDLRRFLRDISHELPAMAVGALTWQRQKISDSRLESHVEFVLFYLHSKQQHSLSSHDVPIR